MNVLDLFSGIGGFSLGLESTKGFRTVAFCEKEPYCQKVLRKHWPDVRVHDDVQTLDGKQYAGSIDVICGGFPCQDISLAGKGAGLAGERSGLWFEFHRLIAEIRPRYAIIENVSALRSRGLDQVLRSLAEIGYDAEWHCIPASAIGAPHRRDRVWIAAYAQSIRLQGRREDGNFSREDGRPNGSLRAEPGFAGEGAENVAYTHEPRLEGWISAILQERACEQSAWTSGASLADTDGEQTQWLTDARLQRNPWCIEPDVGRVANGVPKRVDRITCLGNAIVPQIAALIGEAILQYELSVR